MRVYTISACKARRFGSENKIYPENIPTVFKDKVVAVDLITIYTAKGGFMVTWQAKDFRTELYQGIKKKSIREKIYRTSLQAKDLKRDGNKTEVVWAEEKEGVGCGACLMLWTRDSNHGVERRIRQTWESLAVSGHPNDWARGVRWMLKYFSLAPSTRRHFLGQPASEPAIHPSSQPAPDCLSTNDRKKRPSQAGGWRRGWGRGKRGQWKQARDSPPDEIEGPGRGGKCH